MALTIIGVLSVVALYFYSTPTSKDIDIAVVGIQFRINDQSEGYEEKIITLRGIHKHYLFGNKDSSFQGYFSIEGYDFTYDTEILITLSSPSWAYVSEAGSFGFIQYWDTNNYQNFNFFGALLCTKYLDEFMICIWEPVGENHQGWSHETGLVICAPANNQEEAKKIMDYLYKADVLFE